MDPIFPPWLIALCIAAPFVVAITSHFIYDYIIQRSRP